MAKGAFETGTVKVGEKDIPFIVSRSRRRRRSIAFVMEPTAGLKVMAPARASLSSIHAVLRKHTGWILRKLTELHKHNPVPYAHRFKDGDAVTYLGHKYRLHITRDTTKPQGCVLRPHHFEVVMPDDVMSDENRRQDVRLEILLWLKRRAAMKLQQRMDLWASRLGLRYRRFVVSNPQRRWGSCSGDNVIRLNWRLIMAPLPLIDYVVVHELCHITHKNHSARFWRAVEAAMPDYRQRRKDLQALASILTF